MILRAHNLQELDIFSSAPETFHPIKNINCVGITIIFKTYSSIMMSKIQTSSVRIVATTFTISLKCSLASPER